MNTLKYIYLKGNICTYNLPMLDDNGMSAISIFNNDFGIKFF